MRARHRLVPTVVVGLAACVTPAVAHADLARIAFSGGNAIYTIRADGSERHELVGGSAADPTWSPDGARIAYARLLRSNSTQIWTMRADGADKRALAPAPGRNVTQRSPAWSPDGRSVAFARFRLLRHGGAESSVAVIGADRRHPRTVVKVHSRGLDFVTTPVWSPDGRRLLYTRVKGKHGYTVPSLWTVNADGTGNRPVMNAAGYASWSPDGSRIAAVSTRDHNGQTCGGDECGWNGEIYVMNADGAGLARLTNSRADDETPAWSADGGRIAFASTRNYPDDPGGSFELYSMKPDGSCLTWLTNGRSASEEPAWEPRASLSSDAGACGATARPPLVDTRVPKPALPHGARSWWLGRIAPDGLLLTYADDGYSYDYDDCGSFDPTACPASVDIGNEWVCAREASVLFQYNPVGLRVVRGALFYRDPDPEGDAPPQLYTGTTVIGLQTANARVDQIAGELRPAPDEQPLQGDLPPPRLPDFVWRDLGRVESSFGRLKSVSRVARKLRLSPREVRNRLAVAGRLRALGITGRVNCPARRRAR